MQNETCPREAAVLAAHRSGRWDADLLDHVRRCPACTEVSEVSSCIRNLGVLPDAPSLPDPDRLWLLAQISARRDHTARALEMRTLRQSLQFGLLIAGAAWLALAWMRAGGLSLNVWERTVASPFTAVDVAISALTALATAFVIGGLIIGRPFFGRQLRYLGLL